MNFVINGIEWTVIFVNANSELLTRSDRSRTVGMTDNETKCVYVSNLLYGAFLRKVLCHEIVHTFCFSYNISIPLEQEEFLADWVSLYGEDIIYTLDNVMKNIIRQVA